MRGGEADAHFRGCIGYHCQQAGKVDGLAAFGLVAVAVDVLSEEGGFLEATGAEIGEFSQDAFGRARAFASAGIGDNAVGTEIIASAHDADEA